MTRGSGSSSSASGQNRNLVASINQRLLNIAREQHEEFQSLLTRYALERFLYRVGQSNHVRDFVVKGAVLFSLWGGSTHRATLDLDLLGFGPPDATRLEDVFREICSLPVEDDGLIFLRDTVQGGAIRQDQEYGGIRMRLLAMLGKARIPVQVDIGFGDVVTPAPAQAIFPTLLDQPPPELRTYPRETVVAEKYQALVVLGMANTRMKDFYDLWLLASRFVFNGATLAQAIRATFERRSTPLSTNAPLALTTAFATDPVKQTQWRAFLRKGKLNPTDLALVEVTALLSSFLLPPTHVLSGE